MFCNTIQTEKGTFELAQGLFDAMPLCVSIFDSNLSLIDCNQGAVILFGLGSKQEYLDYFSNLSPKYQPDGRLSSEISVEKITEAFRVGRCHFEWMHQNLNGELIPVDVTMVRVKHSDGCIVGGYARDLRELRASMEKTREADERAQTMLDTMPLSANFWDNEYNNIDCNQETVNLFGLSSKQEYRERFQELQPKYQPDGRLSYEKGQEMIATAFRDGYCRFEWMHRNLKGGPVPVEVTLVRVKYHGHYIVTGYNRDLRELRASMEKTREADERAQIMLDATPLCANFWNRDYRNIDCNLEAVNLFGLNSKQEYLDCFLDLSPQFQPDGMLSSEKVKGKITEAFRNGYCRFEWMHQKLNGEAIPTEVTLVRVKHYGNYIVMSYTRDLRELKNMLDEMHNVEEDLRLVRDAAEKNTKAKSEFLANMSHEIRTPMNAILGMSEVLMSDELTDQQRQHMNDIRVSANALLGIINDILDFSTIEAGKLQLVCGDYDVIQLLRNLTTMFQAAAREKNITFTLEISGEIPTCLYGDDIRIRQVLVNIIGNAIKFTKAGGATLRFSASDGMIHFDVSDTGIGIKPQDIPNIFNDFDRVDLQNTRSIAGTGLGLSITRSLVALMGGTIRVESDYGKGTTFFVQFPLIVGNKDRLSSNAGEAELIHAPEASILVVDDSEVNLRVASALLNLFGIQCDTAISGHEAIDKVEAKRYDIVLMDHIMPEMDGIETTSVLRQKYDANTLIIVALTANAIEGVRETLLDAGMNDYLSKPIDKTELNSLLCRMLPSGMIQKKQRQQPETAANLSPLLAKVAAIEGIDVPLALDRMNGVQSLYEESLAIMVRHLPESVGRLHSFLDGKDLNGFFIEVHGLKGSLNTFGMTQLALAAQRLEFEAKKENLLFCQQNLPALTESLSALHIELATLLAGNAQEQTYTGIGDLETLR